MTYSFTGFSGDIIQCFLPKLLICRGQLIMELLLFLRRATVRFFQETLSLRSRSCFLNFGTYRLALANQIFDSDFCLAGVPQRMTFANYESTYSKPRMDKNKTTNPFGQTTKRCLTAAGATFQDYESEFPDYEWRFSDYDWRSSTWNFQTTNGPKILLRNQNSRGQRTTLTI